MEDYREIMWLWVDEEISFGACEGQGCLGAFFTSMRGESAASVAFEWII